MSSDSKAGQLEFDTWVKEAWDSRHSWHEDHLAGCLAMHGKRIGGWVVDGPRYAKAIDEIFREKTAENLAWAESVGFEVFREFKVLWCVPWTSRPQSEEGHRRFIEQLRAQAKANVEAKS